MEPDGAGPVRLLGRDAADTFAAFKEISEMKKQFVIGAALLLFGGAIVGCSNTAEGAKEDASKAGDAVKTGTENAAENVKKAGDQTVAAAKDAGSTVEKAGTEAVAGAQKAVANLGEAAAVTPKVKGAILADADLSNKENAVIDVDTKDGKVVLRGRVKSNEMKKKAEEITKKTLDDAKYTNPIVNQLTVGIH